MKERSILRKLMIAAGILAALTIVLSPAFQRETNKVITELKSKADAEDRHYVSVSPEAVTTTQAVQVEPANPFMIQEIITDGIQAPAVPVPDIVLPASVLSTLLKTVISPQAP